MPDRLPRVRAADALRALEKAGWYIARRRGSHVRMKHASRPGGVTISLHPGDIVKPKTLKSILDQAGLTVDEFKALL